MKRSWHLGMGPTAGLCKLPDCASGNLVEYIPDEK